MKKKKNFTIRDIAEHAGVSPATVSLVLNGKGEISGETRARVLEISNLISCDMHPMNNLRVLRYLVKEMGVSDEKKNEWYHHWIAEGLTSLEAMLVRTQSGQYCVGGQVSLADCCLVPQIANALRMGCNVTNYPRVMAVYNHCNTLPAFQKAAPAQQPDFQK